MLTRPLVVVVALGAVLSLTACRSVGCLDGDPECVMPSPCEALAFTCDGGFTEAYRLDATAPLPLGFAALAATGDFVLANDQVTVVLDALEHPHYIAPSGGGIIDMVPRDGTVDGLRHIFQAAGLLPGEGALYTSVRIHEDGDVKAVQFMGTLDGRPDQIIATRYEIRPCEPGVRVRTEILNAEADAASWLLSDGWYAGGREALPFVPSPGMGFKYPSFGLSTVPAALRDVPYIVHGVHPGPGPTYTGVACNAPHLSGFISEEVSAMGIGPDLVQPRDWRVFERFVGVSATSSVSGGADLALELRRQLFDEAWTTLSGTIDAPVGPSMVSTGLRASVLISEGSASTPASERVPYTQVFPDDAGVFTARVPADRSYVIEVESYGQNVLEADATVARAPVDVGTLALPGVGEVTLNATVDGEEDHVVVFFVPSDEQTAQDTTGRMFGRFEECAPLLGHPHADSPACNRVLVTGPTTISVPPGSYDVFAVAGPFSTLARIPALSVVAGEGQSIAIDLERLPLQPEGTLSADFHVHGGPSFDAAMNDYDRVRAFLAADLQVIASTEHDVVWDYAQALDALDAGERLALMVGTESTGHILFNYIPTDTNPAVVGHWNFWPIDFDPRGPYRGAAWDEKAEPGMLMQRMRDQAGWDPDLGVAQLNHPISGLQLGRAFGWADSLNIDGNLPLLTEDDGTGQSLFLRTPPADDGGLAAFSNADYHVQEVMNGTNNHDFLKYRAFWFYLLDQGIFRGGTGNSDSHSLTENVLGVPRTMVFTDTTVADFNPVVFNASVRDGRAFGTNGPVLLVSTVDVDGATRTPSLDVFQPATDASLRIAVTAAPWVTVEQVRIYVNSALVQTIPVDDPEDPLSTEATDFLRLDVTVSLADLMPESGDAWVVVEAGPAHLEVADLDCNGFPDTTDNNGDGVIDWRDVEELTEDPGTDCLPASGPLIDKPPPTDREDPLYWFAQVFPGGYPLAITNPLILDLDGGGFTPVLQ